jgi:ATP-dependent protease ClpP protease subunit
VTFLELRGALEPGCAAPLVARIRAADGAGDAIVLSIHSGGGRVAEAIKIRNALLAATVPTRAVVLSGARCESAATLVMLACRQRIAGAHATFLVHNPRGPVPAEVERLRLAMAAAYAEHVPAADAAGWAFLMQQETLMDARGARAIGLIHEVRP